MAFVNKFEFAPPRWLPLQDREMLDRVGRMEIADHEGNVYENPDFRVKVEVDVHVNFAIDLFQRINLSDKLDQKLVLILPSPENAVFLSCVANLNKFRVSCRNVHVFFLYEYANENGDVAPWQSPYSRSGHFMRYFYEKLDGDLRMPLDQIHFWTKETTETYSDLIDAQGGADVAYTALSWSGGIGAIDAETYPAETMDEFLSLGSRYVKPMPEMIAHDAHRGMFGCSGDICNVPPYAVTVGPRDIARAKTRIHVHYLAACGGTPAHQKFPLKLSLFGPICPQNPGSMMRLFSGICFVSQDVAAPSVYEYDEDWLTETIEAIRRKEEG